MKNSRTLATIALAATSALVLAGCAGSAEPGSTESASNDSGKITVVASTNVYGQIAEEIGGDAVEVTSIVSSAAQDPHSFEPSAQDQLAVSRADLVIENGGGYDSFVEALIEASGSGAHVLTVSEFSHDWPGNAGHDDHADGEHSEEGHAEETEAPHDHDHSEGEHAGHDHIEGFNEHVWYDPHTIEHFADQLAVELGELRPEDAETFTANAEAFAQQIGALESSLADIAAKDAEAPVFVTEPVPLYLVAAAGLSNVTPDAFSEAVEEGQDVPPATLLEALGLIENGGVRVVIVNAQTGGAETTRVIDDANSRGIPVIEFAETLPEGQTYISWMQENIAALADALA